MKYIGELGNTGQFYSGTQEYILSATTIPIVQVDCVNGNNITIDPSIIINDDFEIELLNVAEGALYNVTFIGTTDKRVTGIVNTYDGSISLPLLIDDTTTLFIGGKLTNEVRVLTSQSSGGSGTVVVDGTTIVDDQSVIKVGVINSPNIDALESLISYESKVMDFVSYSIDSVTKTSDGVGSIVTSGGIASDLQVGYKIVSMETGFQAVISDFDTNTNTVYYQFAAVTPRELDSYMVIKEILATEGDNISSLNDIIEEEQRGGIYVATSDCDVSGNLVVDFINKRKARIILDRDINNLSFTAPTANIENILEVFQTNKYVINYDSTVDFRPRSSPRHENTSAGLSDFVEVRRIVDGSFTLLKSIGSGVYGSMQFDKIPQADIASTEFHEVGTIMSFLSTNFTESLKDVTINEPLHGIIVVGAKQYVIYDADSSVVLVKTDINEWCVVDNNNDSLLYKQTGVTNYTLPSDVVSWEDGNGTPSIVTCSDITILDDTNRFAYVSSTNSNIKIWKKYGKGYVISNTDTSTEWLYEDTSSGYGVEYPTDVKVWLNAGANVAGSESSTVEPIIIYSSPMYKISAEVEYSKRVVI